MSLHFSANQFEDAYLARRLGNWQVAKSFPERPKLRQGHTKPIANQSGHLLGGLRNAKYATGPSKDECELRFQTQSAPLPQKAGKLCVTGSAVASAKPFYYSSKAVRNNQQSKSDVKAHVPAHNNSASSQESGQKQDGQAQPAKEMRCILNSSKLPDTPRKAAIVLAARQKKHRPLPDISESVRDFVKPQTAELSPTAITVEGGKAKGPTSCTKRQVIHLVQSAGDIQQELVAANVMDLAIKWDSRTPPSSGKKVLRAPSTKPVQKTLDWLYERPEELVIPEEKTALIQLGKSSTSVKQESAKSRDSGVSVRSVAESSASGQKEQRISIEDSDPESGYGTPRSDCRKDDDELLEGKVSELCDFDKVKVKQTSSPPRNHFIVSSAFRKGRQDESVSGYFPEYPLQRRSARSDTFLATVMQPDPKRNSALLLTEHPAQTAETPIPELADVKEASQSRHSAIDSAIGETEFRTHEKPSRSRSRPCAACDRVSQGHATQEQDHRAHTSDFKTAFKAGTALTQQAVDLAKVARRRQDFKAPRPRPLNSYPRHVKGTLVPPFATFARDFGSQVECPDFKRMNSTYQLAFSTQRHPKNRKTLTALLNEKVNKLWR